ncbi:hypothetical protein CKQ80_09515 [Pseudomonas moraviensis]|uniref:Acyltransferase 3 domain-containing protein n=1 Tax=Pseudomonas moraviensis TaxID=321662 RepID=A0A2A2PIP8_9PSED|nr:acyltransferase [Pseudomonas moraviensis]PAW51026.1 hypothetical protein CKQ68_27350 [Pseudomonas moraviensis]PAW55536.1 hypothetical protein CKQ80_09515 [Pseudomonas moraviensis]
MNQRIDIAQGGADLQPIEQATTKPIRHPNFDIMRLFLALEVVFVHAWDAVDPNFNWPGWIMAVPAFLAISGFLVLQSYESSKNWTAFMKKRALRLLPALFASFAVCLVLVDWPATYNSILNWVTGGLYTLPGLKNVPLWSLAWEELAYVILALLWMAGAYRRPICIVALLAFSLVVVGLSADFEPHTRIIMFLAPSFFIGNLMYLYRENLMKVSPVIPWIFLYITIQWRYVPESSYFGGAMLISMHAFSVVWVGMAGFNIARFKFPDISYSAYIYHMPLIHFVLFKFKPQTLTEMLIILSALLIPLCVISWYGLEKPFLALKNKRK